MPQRKWGISATLASPPAPHPGTPGTLGTPGRVCCAQGPTGSQRQDGGGARDEQLLWPLLHGTEQPSQGLRLNCGRLMARAPSRVKCARDPGRRPLTPRDPKQREEERGSQSPGPGPAIVQEASPGWRGSVPPAQGTPHTRCPPGGRDGRAGGTYHPHPASHHPSPCASAGLFRLVSLPQRPPRMGARVGPHSPTQAGGGGSRGPTKPSPRPLKTPLGNGKLRCTGGVRLSGGGLPRSHPLLGFSP